MHCMFTMHISTWHRWVPHNLVDMCVFADIWLTSMCVCNFRLVLGTLYPAYASYKAVKTKDVKEYVSFSFYQRCIILSYIRSYQHWSTLLSFANWCCWFLPKRDYYAFGSLLSQICLSSVTFVHLAQRVETLGNICSPFCTLAILWPPCKILRRLTRGILSARGI